MTSINTKIATKNVILVGLESVGKSAVFRLLSGKRIGAEANYKGSTVVLQKYSDPRSGLLIYDTPGIRLKSDSETTRLALQQAKEADVVVLVARATNLAVELSQVYEAIQADLAGKKLLLVCTFKDKVSASTLQKLEQIEERMNLPTVIMNSREAVGEEYLNIHEAILRAKEHSEVEIDWAFLNKIETTQPHEIIFEHKILGPILSIGFILLMFGLPVYLAYILSDYLQPIFDGLIIDPLQVYMASALESMPMLNALIAGDYGLLTLGWYSLLWAFPVVFFISISMAIVKETGLKDRISTVLDPGLRHIGLSGRDLVPILTGFGCNAVAVLQSRSCSGCNRHACLSMIAIGSACSYQIGASLSLFNVAGHSWLFAPYIFLIAIVGGLHNRVWGYKLPAEQSNSILERAFLQIPTLKAVWWQMRKVLRQFIFTAIPIFFLICLVGAVLQYIGVVDQLAMFFGPVLEYFSLPAETASGLLFSFIRKDGLLMLNVGEGALLEQLSVSQVFLLVYLGSVLSTCMVTLSAIGKEVGVRFMLSMAGKQLLTAIVSALILSQLFKLF